MMSQKGIAYLASPYSHPSDHIRQYRFDKACEATASLLRQGRYVYSPIVHGHTLTRHGIPSDWAFWADFDEAMLSRCDELIVFMLDGWAESEGVQKEIEVARELGIPVKYLMHL